MYRILQQYLDDWFTATSPGTFCSNDEICIPPHTIHDNDAHVIDDNLFCEMDKFYSSTNEVGFTDYCKNIAKRACETAAQYPDLQAEMNRTRVDMAEHESQWNDAAAKLRAVEDEILAADLLHAKAIGILCTGSLAVTIALLSTALGYCLCRGTYDKEIAITLLLNEHLKNPAQANTIINLATRLNIKIDDKTTVAGLIAVLEAKQNEIDERWRQRTAFLYGFKCSEASSHLFFQRADRNVVKMILDEAGLGPVRKP